MNNEVSTMSTNITENSVLGAASLEKVLMQGDLSKLNPNEKLSYYTSLCNSLGLNPLTKPFDYITLNGKLTLYAKRDCTEQLRKINGVSIAISSREISEDCYVVTAKATDKTGRTDESIGAVAISNLKGEARSNAMMKAETKAKRRVTLSICGMGMLDEVEVSSIPNAMVDVSIPTQQQDLSLNDQGKIMINEFMQKCTENNINVKQFATFHNITSENPETVKNAVEKFELFKEEFENARIENTH